MASSKSARMSRSARANKAARASQATQRSEVARALNATPGAAASATAPTTPTQVRSASTGGNSQEPQRLTGWALATVLIGLLLTLLMAALDQTIVSTALPKILGDLHGGAESYTWVVTAYLITSTTLIPVIGKLSDQFGRKWFMVGGVIVFLIGSMLCGAAQDINALIAFRALQGAGASAMLSLVFTSVGDIFTPAERARWQGLFTGVFALASVIGPATGGWLTDNASWRWIFYVNLPIGALALFALIVWLPNSLSLRTASAKGTNVMQRIDIAGAVTIAVAVVALLLGLTWGGSTYPWNSKHVIGILALSVVFFVAFFIAETRAREPILPLDLFKNQIFATGSLLSFTIGAGLFAVVIYLPLFIQGVLGQAATNSGLVTTPLTLALAAGAVVTGFIIARIGRYQVISILGALVLVGGVYLLSRMDIHTGLGEVTRDMIIVGAGMGLLQPVMTLAVQNAIPRTRLGVGTSAVTFLRSLGSTLGTAIIGSVVNNTVSNQLPNYLPAQAKNLPPSLLSAASNQQVLANPGFQNQIIAKAQQAAVQAATQAGRVPASGPAHQAAVSAINAQVADLLHQVFYASREALAVGIQHAFIAGMIICLISLVATLFLKDVPLVGRQQAPAQAGQVAPDEPVAAAHMLG